MHIVEYGGSVNDHRPESPSENSGSPSPMPINAANQQLHQLQQAQHSKQFFLFLKLSRILFRHTKNKKLNEI